MDVLSKLTSETPIGALLVNHVDLDELTDRLRERVERWALQWGVAGLEQRLRMEWSSRLRIALGRARPAAKLIRINAALVDQPFSLLEEVVCHEAAHVAVHELFRGRCRPHGAEWRQLMREAGYAPRVRMALDRLPSRMQPNFVYEHHCPVCQAHRTARRPVRRWRCAACVGVGLAGELVITKLSLRGAA